MAHMHMYKCIIIRIIYTCIFTHISVTVCQQELWTVIGVVYLDWFFIPMTPMFSYQLDGMTLYRCVYVLSTCTCTLCLCAILKVCIIAYSGSLYESVNVIKIKRTRVI